MKNLIKRTPILGPVAMKISRSLEPSSKPKNKPFEFERLAIDPSADNNARSFTQVQNVLNYTKTSQSSYSAKLHPAGYHTIEINGQTLTGQRNPSQRLDSVPFDFNGKSVLDIGCNQGGMLLQLDGTIKWGVGLDYDSRLINAANRIKALRQSNDLQFYSFDLEKDPLPLIEDLIPEPKVDIVFLLSICMWIDNWKDVIQFAARISDTMLFETNGTPEQQTAQRECLDRIYQDVALLNEASEDDPGQKKRTLLLCARPRR